MTDFGDSPYAVLELARSADAGAIEAAYRRLGGLLAEGSLASYGMLDGADVGRLRHQLEQAYAILSDPGRRAIFDRTGDARLAAGVAPASTAVAAPPNSAVAVKAASRADLAANAAGSTSKPTSASAPPSSTNTTFAAPASSASASTAPVHRPKVPGRPALQVPLVAELPEAARFDGQQLRALRESAQVSIEELSEWTKIGRRYLIALEADDFSLLPAKVYVRGFVGEVARTLGIDASRVARSYLEGYDAWSARS